jgi:hypothetical protein
MIEYETRVPHAVLICLGFHDFYGHFLNLWTVHNFIDLFICKFTGLGPPKPGNQQTLTAPKMPDLVCFFVKWLSLYQSLFNQQ